MYFPGILFISLLWNKGKKKNKGEAEQQGSHGCGSRCEGLGDLCSRVTFSSAFTLILSFCPVLIFSLIFFPLSLLHSYPSFPFVSCHCFPLFCTPPSLLSLFLHAGQRSLHSCSFSLTAPLLQNPSQKHSELISISGSLGYLLQRDEPPCCCFQNS